MPDPISSTNRSAYETCDLTTASCAESPPVAPLGAQPAHVTIAPVVITGDAGAQELLRRYDSDQCAAPKQNAMLSCPAIGLGVSSLLEGGTLVASALSALHASAVCGKDLRAVYDCNESSERLKESAAGVVADCHERDGLVKPGASLNEIVCEVSR